jgi:hypothetical protein
MFHESLDVDLIVDEKLELKSPHYYETLQKNPNVSTIGFSSKSPPSSVAHLHLRLAYITVVPYFLPIPLKRVVPTPFSLLHSPRSPMATPFSLLHSA